MVTTNYDIVVEESAYSLNYTVFDGFSFAHKPIFDVDMFEWYLSKPITEVKSQKESYKKRNEFIENSRIINLGKTK